MRAFERVVFLAVAVFAVGACGDECSKGTERCDGNRAQYCSEGFVGGRNTWQDFPSGADCGAVSGCTCEVQGGDAVCVRASSPYACPRPGCADPNGSTLALLVAPALVRWQKRTRHG